MAAKIKQSLGAFGIIAGLSALLVVLGILQFRWSNQIRNADLQRKQAALEAGMNGFREDFRRELAGICTGFTYQPPDPGAAIEDLYAQDCGDWARSSEHRELVANYYFWEKGKSDHYSFLQFNPQQDDSFQATACPARLGVLCDPSDLTNILTSRGGDFGFMGLRWRLLGESLALVRPIPQPGWRNRRNREGCPPDCSPAGFMIVELDRDVFLTRFLPELAKRYFAGPSGLLYDVAIVDGANPPHFIYSSQAHPSSEPGEFAGRGGAFVRLGAGRGDLNPGREISASRATRRDVKGSLRLAPSRDPGATSWRARGGSSPRRSSRTLPPRNGDWWSVIRASSLADSGGDVLEAGPAAGIRGITGARREYGIGFDLDAENPAAGQNADGFCRRGFS